MANPFFANLNSQFQQQTTALQAINYHVAQMLTKVDQAIQQAQQRAAGTAGTGLGASNSAGAGAGLGALMPGGRAFLALERGLTMAAKGLEVLGNSTLTANQKFQKLAEELIPGARAVFAFRDAVTGVADSIRRSRIAFEFAQLREQHGFQLRMTQQAYAQQISGQQGMAGALFQARFGMAPLMGATTFQGDIAAREAQVRFGTATRTTMGRAELEGIKQAIHDSEFRQRDLRRIYGEQAFHRRGAEAALKGARQKGNDQIFGSNKAEVNHEALEVIRQTTAEENTRRQLEAEINHQKELGVRLAEKESALRKLGIQATKDELGFLRQREQILVSQSTRLGGQTMMDRRLGLEAARFIKRHGIAAATPEMQALAGQFAPEYLQKTREQFGRTTAEYRAGVAEGFLLEGDVGANRKEQQGLQTRIIEEEARDARVLAGTIARVFRDALTQLEPLMREAAEQAVAKMRAGLIQQQAHQ